MDSDKTIQIIVARVDLFLVTAGYILVRVLIVITVIVCIAGIIIMSIRNEMNDGSRSRRMRMGEREESAVREKGIANKRNRQYQGLFN